MKRLALSIALGLVCGASLAATSTTRFLIFVENGKQAGEQIVEHDDDGSERVRFIFKDNGRGPELRETLKVGKDGSLLAYTATGNSTFGGVVNDRFERSGDTARWQSTTEQGSTRVQGTAAYVPLVSSFQPAALAIRAMAARPDKSLALLPSGTMRMKVLESRTLSQGGKNQAVQLVALTGVGLSPQFAWVTREARPQLFAVVIPGYMTMIREGWQAQGKTLATAQKAAEGKLLVDLAAQLQHPLTGLTVVRNARVFDSEKAELTAPQDVYVLRGRITAMLPAGAPVRGAVNEIDAAGRVLLPGLFDMHGHVGRWEGGLNLAAGVTSVRDMGNDNATLQDILDETASGRLLSPQIVPAGFLEGESPYSANNGFVVKDLRGAKSAIDWYAEHGYPQLKIYNSFPKEILKETVAYAHERGLRVSGHIPAGLRAQQAIDAGYDEIQHINQLMLNFLFTPEVDTRTLQRFYLPSEKVADLDLDSAPVQEFIATLKQKQIAIDPTLATFAFLKQKDGEINEPFAPIADHMPPDVKRGFAVGTMKIPDDATLQRYRKSYAKMVDFVGRAYRAGVPVLAGTDELAGFTLQAELAYLVKAGLTPAQALQVATRNGAQYTRTSHERGSITPGKLADLVLVDGDPTRDIGDIRKVAAVITRGYLVYPREVHQALGVAPFVAANPAVTRLPASSASVAAGGNEGMLGVLGLGKHRD
ncbi:amidohydrolase family protein [Massilia sp. TS11]|uniref:amidohydrolase family protein n=1 Tax=Massilia sp. TS11 TaxID=2908003 RepID=UPI001EDB67ED|nr:amidohydrolase family protein [Massilia sp. TS11]MCG2585855.1 amidohydrolase family protein [Massilia sp. TS11]